MAGSKFDGTGFEYVHIGQTQVALAILTAEALCEWNGLPLRTRGEDGLPGEPDLVPCGVIELPVELRFWPGPRFDGFGYIVILGEDFKKPACEIAQSQGFAHGAN